MISWHFIFQRTQRTLIFWFFLTSRLLSSILTEERFIFLSSFSLWSIHRILFVCSWSKSASSRKTSLSFIWNGEGFSRLLGIWSLSPSRIHRLISGCTRLRIIISLLFSHPFTESFLTHSSFFQRFELRQLWLLQFHVGKDALQGKWCIPLFVGLYVADIDALLHVRIFVFSILTPFRHQIVQSFLHFSWSTNWLWLFLSCFRMQYDLLLSLSSDTGRSSFSLHLHTWPSFIRFLDCVVLIFLFREPKLPERRLYHIWIDKSHWLSRTSPLFSFSWTNFFREIVGDFYSWILIPTRDEVSTSSQLSVRLFLSPSRYFLPSCWIPDTPLCIPAPITFSIVGRTSLLSRPRGGDRRLCISHNSIVSRILLFLLPSVHWLHRAGSV